MSDSTDPTKPEQPPAPPRPSWRRRIIEKPKGYLEQRHANQKEETPEQRYARKAAAATVWMAVFTIVIAVVGFLQWRVIRSQLGEMHSGGVDTHNLAVATGKLKDAAAKQAVEIAGLKAATEHLAVAMGRQADSTALVARATIVTANAQSKLARIASISTIPVLEMRELRLFGLKSDPMPDGRIPVKIAFNFVNIGSGRLTGRDMSIVLVTDTALPSKPAYGTSARLTRTIPTGEGFSPDGWIFAMPKADIEDILGNKKTAFLVGYVSFTDALNVRHRQCFAFAMKSDGSDGTAGFYETGTDSYRCQT